MQVLGALAGEMILSSFPLPADSSLQVSPHLFSPCLDLGLVKKLDFRENDQERGGRLAGNAP